jgi:hypothetical protein
MLAAHLGRQSHSDTAELGRHQELFGGFLSLMIPFARSLARIACVRALGCIERDTAKAACRTCQPGPLVRRVTDAAVFLSFDAMRGFLRDRKRPLIALA